MRILMLVNWKVRKCEKIPEDIQAPDYIVPDEKYWFFRYFPEDTQVDVIDISSFSFWEKFERNKLHFYIIQPIKALFRTRKYDIVLSHGMPSGIVLALLRRLFKTRAKHIVFDIGSFNSAAESGKILKLNQFASKSIDGIIYHSSNQIEYYKKFYPWIVNKSKFIPFGTDLEYFSRYELDNIKSEKYILAVGYKMRDIKTLLSAFKNINTDLKLRIIGGDNIECNDERVECIAPIPKKELNYQIQKAEFCVLPLVEKKYSYGQMTLLQQMYYGKAVITADVTSMKDYVENNETAILYEQQNVEDLQRKIELLIKNENLKQRIGLNSKNIVINNYNEKNMAKEICIFLKEII